MKVDYHRTSISPDDIQRLTNVMQSGMLTTGQVTQKFEEQLSKFLGRQHCVGTTNCTSSLEAAIRYYDIGEGDEVLVPSMSYVSSAHCAAIAGAKPIFVESDPQTGLLDISDMESKITENTKAIIPVHLYGVMPDMKRIQEITSARGIKIIEDAAHAIEAERDDYSPGGIGNSAHFSFYATKNMACGEGGALVTDDQQLYEWVQKARRGGVTKDVSSRSSKRRYQHYDVGMVSGKFNMTNIDASLLLGQLTRINDNWDKRNTIYQRYTEQLQEIEGITIPHIPAEAKSAHHLYVILVQRGTREDVFDLLGEHNIGVALNFRPIHLMKIYREKYGWREGNLPIAEDWGERCISLPMYPSLTDGEINYVCETLKDNYPKILKK